MDVVEALTLLVELVEVLDAAETELLQLDDTEMPVPDKVLSQLEERDAMERMLTRLFGASADPPQMRALAQALYREERARACRTDSSGENVSVSADVLRQFAEMRETLRRRALVESDLATALDGALLRSAVGM